MKLFILILSHIIFQSANHTSTDPIRYTPEEFSLDDQRYILRFVLENSLLDSDYQYVEPIFAPPKDSMNSKVLVNLNSDYLSLENGFWKRNFSRMDEKLFKVQEFKYSSLPGGIFNSIDIEESISVVTKLEKGFGLAYFYVSEIYSFEKDFFVAVDYTTELKDSGVYVHKTVVYKFKICQNNVIVFEEKYILLGLSEDKITNVHERIKISDIPCLK